MQYHRAVEFLVLAGAFSKTKIIAAFAIPGAVLAAAYMLRMLQKVVWGGTNNPDQSYLTDLNVREIITLAPLLLFVLWIGLNPAPFMDVMHTSVSHLIQQVGLAGADQQSFIEIAKLVIPQ
jgi:NADH-quinone oxidoreductase subunit M